MPNVPSRKLGASKDAAKAELEGLAVEVAAFMRKHRGGSVMVRSWVDDRGHTNVACNLYLQSATRRGAREPAIQFRKVVSCDE